MPLRHPLTAAPTLSHDLSIFRFLSSRQSITSEMRSDPDVVAVRSGGMPASMGRGKTGLMPAPSLGWVLHSLPALACLSLPCAVRMRFSPFSSSSECFERSQGRGS